MKQSLRALELALLERKREVLTSLGVKFDTIASMGRVAEEDQAQLSHEEFISLQRNSWDYEQLRLVEEALDRLQSGDYGVCQRCERSIPPKRLAAVPYARYCVPCQEAVAAGEAEEEAPARVHDAA